MQKETAHYPDYYGDLSVQVFSPRFYFDTRSSKNDEYSKLLVVGKHKDLSEYFFKPIVDVFTQLPFKPSLVVVAPSSEKSKFSPTLDSIAKRLMKDYGLPYANVIERIREGKKLTTCKHLAERYEQVNGAFSVNYNMEGLKVVILDDTKTTGLTTLECTKMLIDCGAVAVVAVCLGIHRS